ncbi:MAG: BON domain-containing protein [Bacteroidota bacterium]|nr:BON domain-containing protein [Bacteroidota bacterium]
MKPIYYQIAILFISGLLFACNNQPTDTEIQQNINNSFKKDLAGAALNATVDSGVATITGQCEGDGCTAQVVERVKKMKGVKEVKTNIVEKK